MQAPRGDAAGSVPDPCEEASLSCWFPRAHESHVYNILQSINCATASRPRNVPTLMKKYLIARNCCHLTFQS